MRERLSNFWKKVVPVLATISIEPVFLLDGLAFSIMIILVEDIQFRKICSVNLNFTQEVCNNITEYSEEQELYNSEVASFKRNDGIITSVIPLFFIMFIGAWSDKYGRKIPLCLTLLCHFLYAGGYLFNSVFSFLRVEYLLVVGFLDSIGGGSVAFLTVANAYISDVTSEESRTTRVALANSLWFLGGPIGTLLGTQLYHAFGYNTVFTTSLVLYAVSLLYIGLLLPECHGPFADREKLKNISKPINSIRLRDSIVRLYGISKRKRVGDAKSIKHTEKITATKMFFDFFDIRKVATSLECVLKKRDGYTRLFILLLIVGNFFRKIGRGAYMYHFARRVLHWDTEDYGYFTTYKNVISTLGSLFVVPLLSTRLRVSDSVLALIGSASSVFDYILYGLVTGATPFIIWIAPVAALLVNSCSIAMRSMMSKYVNSDELGQVSAVTGTIEGIVPIISTSIYSPITKSTFATFPGAQFFFGALCNLIMVLIFVFIMCIDRSDKYDIESATLPPQPEPVQHKKMVIKKDSNWLICSKTKSIRRSTILLSDMNFSIEVPCINRVFSKKKTTMDIIREEEEAAANGHIPSPSNNTDPSVVEANAGLPRTNGHPQTVPQGVSNLAFVHEK